jgi:hypothetical protein
MSTLPADEDYAMSLLTIFRSAGIRARQSLRAAQVNRDFLTLNLGRQADYQAALAYAQERGWLSAEFGMIRLSKHGFDEIC